VISDFNPTLALAAETIFLPVRPTWPSDYINCIALLCLNKYVCMYLDVGRRSTQCIIIDFFNSFFTFLTFLLLRKSTAFLRFYYVSERSEQLSLRLLSAKL